MRRLKNFLIRRQLRVISRAHLMRTLDQNFESAGVRLTVGRYNQILADLGFDLEDVPL
jgi:hypothetical protein